MRHTRSCLLCFFDNPYISPLNSHNFLFTWLCSFFTCLHSSWNFAPPKKWLFSVVTWGIKCIVGMYVGQLRNFCRVLSIVGRTCGEKAACIDFLCFLSMVLKTRGLGTGVGGNSVPPYLQPDPEEEHCDFVKTTLMNISHILHHISSNFLLGLSLHGDLHLHVSRC